MDLSYVYKNILPFCRNKNPKKKKKKQNKTTTKTNKQTNIQKKKRMKKDGPLLLYIIEPLFDNDIAN